MRPVSQEPAIETSVVRNKLTSLYANLQQLSTAAAYLLQQENQDIGETKRDEKSVLNTETNSLALMNLLTFKVME